MTAPGAYIWRAPLKITNSKKTLWAAIIPQSISKYVEIQNLTANTTLWLDFHYENKDVKNIDKESLKVWKHNSTAWDEGVGNDSWNGTRKRDTANNIVGVEVLKFCILAPLAGLSVHNINTDEDFNIIQEAIDDPDTEDGHTITVDPDYTEAETKENILVSKKLTIKSSSGNSTDTVIEAADNGKHVIEVTADDVTIQGFTIKGAKGENSKGVYLHGNTIQGCTISQNFITENKCSIYLAGAKSNTIKENIISGNELSGIEIKGEGTEENKVIGNYIGTDKSGTKALGNGIGITIRKGAKKNIIGGKLEGHRLSLKGNVVSGNKKTGLYINNLGIIGSDRNEVLGNYIGTDKYGTTALPNEEYGVVIRGRVWYNFIGRYEGGRNVISGNKKSGIVVIGPNTNRNEILGNYIGTDKDGT